MAKVSATDCCLVDDTPKPQKERKLSRRALLRIGFYSIPVLCVLDTFWFEPEWVRIKRLKIGSNPTTKLVHFTDIHFKGDRAYLTRVVNLINGLSPDIVCFTGDIVEEASYLDEALEILAKIKVPLFGVPGNWEHLSKAPVEKIATYFEATGGA